MYILEKAAIQAVTSSPGKERAKQFLVKLCSSLKNHVQISLPEICTKLLDLPMVYKSHNYEVLFIFELYQFWEKVQKGHSDIENELATCAVMNNSGISI